MILLWNMIRERDDGCYYHATDGVHMIREYHATDGILPSY